jgi:hypothetical protein
MGISAAFETAVGLLLDTHHPTPLPPAARTDIANDVEEVPLTIMDTDDDEPWPAQPSGTIDPRELGLFGPGVRALVTSEYDEDASSLPVLTPSDDGNTTSGAAHDMLVNAAQKLREVIEKDRQMRSDEKVGEEPESEEEDDATRDATRDAKKSKQVGQSQEAGLVAREASASNARVKKTRGKSTVKVEEVFTYAPDREPDISNVRIVHNVSDDSDEEVVSKVAPGKNYKRDDSVKLPRIKESDAWVDYTYLASTKTVSFF